MILAHGMINNAVNLINETRTQFGWYNVTRAVYLNSYQAEGVKTIAYEMAADLDQQVSH